MNVIRRALAIIAFMVGVLGVVEYELYYLGFKLFGIIIGTLGLLLWEPWLLEKFLNRTPTLSEQKIFEVIGVFLAVGSFLSLLVGYLRGPY